MSKIMIGILAVAAFVYAVWLVVFRRPLPEVKSRKGLRRRFILGTLLFVGLLSTQWKIGCVCYLPMPPEKTVTRHEVAATLRAVWRTLDPKRSDEFRQELEVAAAEGKIRHKTADMLAIAYSELAYHKKRTRRDGPPVLCYEMTRLGGTLMRSRENALKQVELLAKARQSGVIDPETASKAHAALGREIQWLQQAKGLQQVEITDRSDRQVVDYLIARYEAGGITPSTAASTAATIVVQMETEGPF